MPGSRELLGYRRLGRFGNEYIEGEARERARRHNEQSLALDHVFDRSKRTFMELMRPREIER
jgi:hypothetical protein